MGENEKIIKINIEKAPGFKFIPATGAMGGRNPQGEIICNFYVEHPKYPTIEIVLDQATGQTKSERTDSGNSFIREMQIAVVMRPDIALSVGEWLVKQAMSVMPPENKTIN